MGKDKKRTWKRKTRMMKSEDEAMKGGRNTDIVIPVMGPTGVGKSTFINTLLGENHMHVGHDITSCTSKLEHAIITPISNRPALTDYRLVIVDTPGFDDTYEDDAEILRRIAVWLASSYDDGMELGGVVYLQNIAERRLEGTTRRNLNMFSKLCGTAALARVVLATTNWGEVTSEVGIRRERELADKFWKEMTDAGSEMRRFNSTQTSAMAILDVILDKIERRPHQLDTTDMIGDKKDDVVHALRIQEELVDFQQSIPETDAGKELRYALQQVLREQRDMAGGGDPEEKAALAAKQENVLKQIKDLQIPLSRRILAFLRFTASPSHSRLMDD